MGRQQPRQHRLPEVRPHPVRRQDDHGRDADAAHDERARTSGSGGTTTVRQVSDDSWTEADLTYTNRKPLGSTTILVRWWPLSSVNSSYSLTLTPSALQSDVGSTLSLGLTTTSSDGLGLATREASAGAATLQLTFK